MSPDRYIRTLLWMTVPLNLLGTGIFLAAAMGHPPAVLPVVPPPLYAAQVALVIAIFAGVYAWLAFQPVINAPLLLVGAIGKAGFFGIFAVFWVAGEVDGGQLLNASPDLILGLAFGGWMWLNMRRGRHAALQGAPHQATGAP